MLATWANVIRHDILEKRTDLLVATFAAVRPPQAFAFLCDPTHAAL
jgi:hypothetical protein